MRRRSRELSIFTLSALDVLAMATGVFVLLLVMLMPYHRKVADAHAAIEAVRIAEAETEARVQTLEAAGSLHRAEAEAAEAEAAALLAQAASLRQAAAERRRQARQGSATQEAEGDVTTPVIEAIDLVFVIDTTASMGPAIRGLAVSMRSVIRILERLVPSVRIGVAAYKDRDIPLPPVTTLPLTAADPHLPRIVGFMDNLEASPIGSRDLPEDVHLGLDAAVRMQWRPDARQVIVVIGDAEAHPQHVNEAFARARHFVSGNRLRTVSTLFVSTPSSRSAGNRSRPFFQLLADAGGGEFNDHAGSMIESVLLSVFVD